MLVIHKIITMRTIIVKISLNDNFLLLAIGWFGSAC